VRDPGLHGVSIGQEDLTYRYELPSSWLQGSDQQALESLRTLAQELRPLLIEMTGPVVVRRLAQVTALHAAGITLLEEVRR
jgi:hypothetical protein